MFQDGYLKDIKIYYKKLILFYLKKIYNVY